MMQIVIITLREGIEADGPEGVYGKWLTYLMVLIPACWLALVLWFISPRTYLWVRQLCAARGRYGAGTC